MRTQQQQYARELSRMSRADRVFTKALRTFPFDGVNSVRDSVRAALIRKASIQAKEGKNE